MSQVLELHGCTPEPLMSYLKALGIFRLVSEQKDRSARAWWENDKFMLRSALDQDALVEFFLEEYRPTPVVAPWNNRFRTGVMKGDKLGLDVISCSSEERFSAYRCHIEKSKKILKQEEDKGRILAKCRTQFSDEALDWLDAVYVLTAERPAYPPLTSNGGTLGTSSSGDISMNFAKNFVGALNLSKRRGRHAVSPSDWLKGAVFGSGNPKLTASAGGQFSPGGWGPNSTVGFEADSLINPWDFLLLVEGTLAFAGAPVRRLAPEVEARQYSRSLLMLRPLDMALRHLLSTQALGRSSGHHCGTGPRHWESCCMLRLKDARNLEDAKQPMEQGSLGRLPVLA